MSDSIIFLTGATDGIGKLAAKKLASKGAHLILHGRDSIKLERLMIEIEEECHSRNMESFIADFSSMKEVKDLANNVLSRYDKVDVLINNAGAGFADKRYGKDGMELRFSVNYLAPFLLTTLLLPVIKNAAPSRIVNVSSAGQSSINFDDIMLEKDFDGVRAYSQSKLALIMFTFDLAEELKGRQVTVNAMHPGTYLDTNMVREAGIKPLGSAESGADAEVYLATSPAVEGVTGKYFNVSSEAKAHAQAYDKAARKRLRELTLALVDID